DYYCCSYVGKYTLLF
nr:immunoglobulin light chain junction region [Macaca mulatta]